LPREQFSDDNHAWLGYASRTVGKPAKEGEAGQTAPAGEQAQHVNPAAIAAAFMTSEA
jgi:hypothetical protein